MYVLTIDQRDSRRQADAVPVLLTRLNAAAGAVLPFERTAGDEVQALLDDPAAVVDLALAVVREGTWWVGIGVGEVERPLPTHARAGRGEAYVQARAAVGAAKRSAAGVAVRGDGNTSYADAALVLLAHVVGRRTARGWEVVDLVRAGLTQADAAQRLGVSPQAAGARLRVAGWAEERRGRDLLAWLLGGCPDGGVGGSGQDGRPDGTAGTEDGQETT